jgi:hypothetical protein
MVVKTGAKHLERILLCKEDRSGLQLNSLKIKYATSSNDESK